MSTNKKYFYMRLKENFFDTDSMILLESVPDGLIYSNILLKMYLKSLKCEGKLMLNDVIPYNAQMIATITRHQVGTVEKALQIFEQLGLIDILDNGTIYMSDIELMIGQSSTEGERKKKARLKISKEKSGQIEDKCPPVDKRPPEIEIELEKELNIYNNINVSKETLSQSDKHETIVNHWNKTIVNPQVKALNAKRKKQLNALLKDYGLEQILLTITLVKNTPFLRGENNRGWNADFDFFLSKYLQICEGKYATNPKQSKNNMELNREIDFDEYEKLILSN